MKIIQVDAFDRDMPERLVASELTPEAAKAQCDELNARQGEHGDRWHRVVEDSHRLRTAEDIYGV